MKKEPVTIRFFKYLELIPFHTCWEWTGYLQKNNGYGLIRNGKNMELAHRISFMLFKGPIKNNYVIDHICKNRSCVNPDHLRQVTNNQNTLFNSDSPSALNKNKTHCKNGHEYNETNSRISIYKRKGYIRETRVCKICKTDYDKNYWLNTKKLKIKND